MKAAPVAHFSQRQPRSRRGKRLVTPAQARRLAARHVLNRLFKGATVRSGASVRLGVYLRAGWAAKDVWVVYQNSDTLELKSSTVLLVCKRTGRVLYEGSAGDEG